MPKPSGTGEGQMSVRKWTAYTEYDEKHEPIMTNLYRYGKFVFAIGGWMNTDEAVKQYKQYQKAKVKHE